MTLLLFTLACDMPRDGTAVGNPGNAGLTGTEMPDGVDWHQADADAKAIRLVDDGRLGSTQWIEVHETVDLLAPVSSQVRIPTGRWDRMELVLATDGLRLRGEIEGGVDFDVTLDAQVLTIEGPIVVEPGDNLLIAVPLSDAVDLDAIEYHGTHTVLVHADDPAAQHWADALADATQLWRDLDDDGVPSPGDRQLGGPLQLHAMSHGVQGGCATGAGGAAMWLALLGAGLVRRRRWS